MNLSNVLPRQCLAADQQQCDHISFKPFVFDAVNCPMSFNSVKRANIGRLYFYLLIKKPKVIQLNRISI